MANFHVHKGLATWRRVALSTWRRGDDPTVYGWIDVDATNLKDYVQRLRDATGKHVTLTHVIGKAAALAFARNPECNGIVSLGRLKLRDSVDVFFQVAFEGGKNLAGAKVNGADKLSVPEISDELLRLSQRIRGKGDSDLQKSQKNLKGLPGILMGPILRASEFAMYDLGMDLSRFGIAYDAFGSVMVTNVGMWGLEHGFAPLLPISRVPALLTVGAVTDRVIAVNGTPQVRPVVSIGATFDHRIVDGYQLGQLAKVLIPALEHPEDHLGSVPARTQTVTDSSERTSTGGGARNGK